MTQRLEYEFETEVHRYKQYLENYIKALNHLQKLNHLESQGWKSQSERDSWELEFQWLAGSHFLHCTRFQEYEIIIN